MFGYFKRRKRERYLAGNPIPDSLWQRVINLPLFIGLTDYEHNRLRQHAAWFLHEKTITAVGGLALTDEMRVLLAAQASLPILHLGFDAYDDWHEVILYPGQFVSRDRYTDRSGLVHEYEQVLAGQARSDGPVLLSWMDVNESPWLDGWNVVIHEFAHKLDMRSGEANGCPPLHKGMSYEAWKRAFSRAYDDLVMRADQDHYSPIDLYAAENPAECFAVFSEYFFETPHAIADHYPAVYAQLCAFYKQDPLARLPRVRYRPAFEPVSFGPVVPTPAPGVWL
ncbi:M90 family metallopeptidase [Andreprevotia chitinilytica]|uniref:M90 family metallopeptidase n=1 Tax=Andreprevotia chitinilytica TaxID=396808 RepID=UPI0009FFA274|nr:M90 family metallopeptidase [Andreprevotia chitinilytica]